MQRITYAFNFEVFYPVLIPFRNFVCSVIAQHFPELTAHIVETNARLKSRFGVDPPFGLFWNFCVNAPYPKAGVREVICEPHVDAMNGAILLCAVLVYYVGPGESNCCIQPLRC